MFCDLVTAWRDNAIDLLHLSSWWNSFGVHPVANVDELCIQVLHQLYCPLPTVMATTELELAS